MLNKKSNYLWEGEGVYWLMSWSGDNIYQVQQWGSRYIRRDLHVVTKWLEVAL